MIPIRRYLNLRPGDVLYTKEAVPRWIGSISWYAGKVCDKGDTLLVTDVYPSGCRVLHPEGGIHFFTSTRQLKTLKLLRHDRKPSDEAARRYTPNRDYGTWPKYKGAYRLSKYTPPRLISRPPTAKVSSRSETPKVSSKKNFAVNAKRKPNRAIRHNNKTKRTK